MYKESVILEMFEALAFANDIRQRRRVEERYASFTRTMSKLTEAENEVKTISGVSYVTLKDYRHEDILHLASTISKAKLKAFIDEGTCEHVLKGANPCKSCIQNAGPRIADEAVKLACQQLPKAYGRLA